MKAKEQVANNMTEIEEKFFETFNIKPKYILCPANYYSYKCGKTNRNDADCPCNSEVYPQITSDILLKLICILVQWDKDYEYLITSKYISDLKQEILNDCIQSAKQFNEYFIEQVQSLFTERKI